jgi:hypothetical protein
LDGLLEEVPLPPKAPTTAAERFASCLATALALSGIGGAKVLIELELATLVLWAETNPCPHRLRTFTAWCEYLMMYQKDGAV